MKKVVVLILLAAALQALTLKDMFYSNSTGANAWNAPTGGKYFYGGNIEIRFKNPGTTYPLWFNAQPPEYQVGCNGLSIKGGFLSLLGLNDIKDQLSNAGSQFAWGIMVGLVYSMPGISDVFMKLQKWARTIQNLLQNSCKIGMSISRNSKMGKAAKEVFDNINDSFEDLKDATGNIDAAFKEIDKFVDEKLGKDKKPSSMASSIVPIGDNSLGISLFASYFGEYMPPAGDMKRYVFSGTISNIFNKKFDKLNLIVTDETNFERKVLFYKLASLIYGDLRANNEVMGVLKNLFSNGQIDTEKAKSYLKSIISGGVKKLNDVAPIYTPPKITPEDAAKGLIEGFGKIDGCDANTNTCTIPNNYVDYYVLPKYTNSKTTSPDVFKDALRALVVYSSSNGTLSIKWNGFYSESLKAIRDIVKNKVNTPNYRYVTTDNIPDSTTLDNAILFVPGISKYLNLISLLEKKDGNTENAYTYSLKVMLAKFNAYLGARQFAGYVAGYIVNLMNEPNTLVNEKTREALMEYLKRIREVQAQINAKIKDYYKSEENLNNVINTFKDIEKSLKSQIQQDGLK